MYIYTYLILLPLRSNARVLSFSTKSHKVPPDKNKKRVTTYLQTNRQTITTYLQTNRQTIKQTNTQTNKQTHKCLYVCLYTYIAFSFHFAPRLESCVSAQCPTKSRQIIYLYTSIYIHMYIYIHISFSLHFAQML